MEFAFRQDSSKRKVLLIADNRYGLNWGCRATSLALIDILENNSFAVNTLSEILEQRDSTTSLSKFSGFSSERIKDGFSRANSILEKVLRKVLKLQMSNSFDIRNLDLTVAAKDLRRISHSNTNAEKILNAIQEADVVVINGEGDAIFTNPPRPKFLFLLLIMQLANEFKKPVCYVNAIISKCPTHGLHTPTVEAFIRVTKEIQLMALRDRESFNLAKQLGFSPQNLVLQPDALFSIRDKLISGYNSSSREIHLPNLATHPEARLSEEFSLVSHEYICISAASVSPGTNRQIWKEWFSQLVSRLKREFSQPLIFVQPCTGDDFVPAVSKQCDVVYVPAETNIYWGSRILANSSVYITGRYHPSIMASFGGVPQVMLSSNSHKTRSLQVLLGEENPVVYPIASGENTIDLIVKSTKEALDEDPENRKSRIKRVEELGKQASLLGEQILG